ncbi:MAG TPA: hypothetical protein VKY40_09465 [Halanaerobiales bacterium]|nr:hypothetical protein [Halanaerobiales bacterium]
MDYKEINNILAIIVIKDAKHKVGGGVPVFIVEDEKEQQKIGSLLARLTLSMLHDLGNGINIIIKH